MADDKPTAAVWWRVSTAAQGEISPDTQRNEALKLAQAEGYHVPPEYVIGGDWGSESVWDSPLMERLRQLIQGRHIAAIFTYHSDRLPAKPAHRLFLRALCEQNSVKLRACHGQIPDGDFGEVLEFLGSWAKLQSVQRAQQGSKTGLHDRAKLKGKPVNNSVPYGYRFLYALDGKGRRVPVGIEPNPETWPIAKRIWEMALAGNTLRGIAVKLTADGIPTIKGGPAWGYTTIEQILKNPVYAGRYYALKYEAAEPQQRKGNGYGKTSARRTSDPVYLPDFPVKQPILTWEEFCTAQEIIANNKLYSRRAAARVYLLSQLTYCEKHQVKGTA